VNLNFINVLFEFCSKQGIMLKNSFRWVTIWQGSICIDVQRTES
jgi:hypothetical protein